MDMERRRESVIDNFASLALEGLVATPEDLNQAWEYITGQATLDELLERLHADGLSPFDADIYQVPGPLL